MSDHFVRHILTSGDTVKAEFECRAEVGASCRSACDCYDKEYEMCESPGAGDDKHPRTDRGECLQLVFITEGDPDYSYDGPDRPVCGPDWQPITLEWQGEYFTWDYEAQHPDPMTGTRS